MQVYAVKTVFRSNKQIEKSLHRRVNVMFQYYCLMKEEHI